MKFLVLLAAVTAAVTATLIGGGAAKAQVCPTTPPVNAPIPQACYYPEPVVRLNGQPTLTIYVGDTASGTWSYSGADPARGCQLGGGWSGSAGGASGSGSRTVGPYSSPISIQFNVNCPGSAPGYGYGAAQLTVINRPSPPPPPGPPPPPPPPSGCTPWAVDEAEFVSWQPGAATIAAGTTRTVSVTMKNTGPNPWTVAGTYMLSSQNPANNTTWGISRVPLWGPESIAPCASKTFTFNITAPATAGARNFQWRMIRNSTSNTFGAYTPNLVITVTGSAPPPPAPPPPSPPPPTPPPPPDPDPFRWLCAVYPSAVTPLGGYIQGWAKNECRPKSNADPRPYRMVVSACLMRWVGGSSEPIEHTCNWNQTFGGLSVTVNMSHLCNYTTYPYTWYVAVVGRAFFAPPAKLPPVTTSPTTYGPKTIYQCN